MVFKSYKTYSKRKYMKSLYLILFFLLSSKSNSQDLKIQIVKFSYHQTSVYQGPMKEVYIVLALNDKYGKEITVYVTIDENKTTSFELPLEKLVEISNEILKLKPEDIIEDTNLIALDAATTSLSFGNLWQTVTYSVYDLDNGDENSTRREFLKVINKILEIANVKIRGLN